MWLLVWFGVCVCVCLCVGVGLLAFCRLFWIQRLSNAWFGIHISVFGWVSGCGGCMWLLIRGGVWHELSLSKAFFIFIFLVWGV